MPRCGPGASTDHLPRLRKNHLTLGDEPQAQRPQRAQKEGNYFRSNQARGAGYEELHDCYLCGRWEGEGKGIFGPALRGLGRLAELRRAARMCP